MERGGGHESGEGGRADRNLCGARGSVAAVQAAEAAVHSRLGPHGVHTGQKEEGIRRAERDLATPP